MRLPLSYIIYILFVLKYKYFAFILHEYQLSNVNLIDSHVAYIDKSISVALTIKKKSVKVILLK